MSSSQWSDLDRPPLRGEALERALVRPGGLWTSVRVVAETGSTNSDLMAEAAAGAPGEAVLIAEEQTAGRGRLERAWTAPARSGVFLSVLLRPEVPRVHWSWLPLLVGVSAGSALSRAAEVDVRLKWPNDLLVTVDGEERKLGGILAELTPDSEAVVVGIGINVSLREDELPVPTAGSLELAGAKVTDRETLVRVLLRTFEELYREWASVDGDPETSGLHAAYNAQCATLGRQVRVELPGGLDLVGEAVSVDPQGRLVVRRADGTEEAVGAGDVVHVRPGGMPRIG
ncbi:biotin--[acetyl-CoA-carboxylase] ligase [Streptacidiphilus sp. EB129]|uniref:biotin--[acetyl-CoA-carboxylase] ligase n=1 Tax=Streptacidiphilus sp. EB129 TaxID=3156262 RepID=UPI003515156C